MAQNFCLSVKIFKVRDHLKFEVLYMLLKPNYRDTNLIN